MWDPQKEGRGEFKNTNLNSAKRAKQDEFYTQWADIEKEMSAYLAHNPEVFRGKTILLPCDDPEWSSFTKFFSSRFRDYGIKKLISTSYALEEERGKIFILDSADENNDGRESLEDIAWDYLKGDGDFRSDEIKELRDEADMVITNPPFSLFREFMAWLVEGDVEFAVLGNMNAASYKDIFPLIKENKMWLGDTIHSGDTEFRVPDSYPLNAARFRTDEEGNNYVRVSVRWYTNIQYGCKNEPLPLMTMDDNLRFNKRIINNPNSYKTYDNYDAIEVPVTAGIPSDYKGVMGVPITFLDKYTPEQFEIINYKYGDDGKHLRYTQDDGTSKTPYIRILIRHKTQPEKE